MWKHTGGGDRIFYASVSIRQVFGKVFFDDTSRFKFPPSSYGFCLHHGLCLASRLWNFYSASLTIEQVWKITHPVKCCDALGG